MSQHQRITNKGFQHIMDDFSIFRIFSYFIRKGKDILILFSG